MSGVALFCMAVTIGSYALARCSAMRHPSPFTSPVFLSTVLIVAVLLAADIGYPDYVPARNAMTLLLGPATVALAVPIYRNRATLMGHAIPAIAGIVAGAASTIVVAVLLATLFQLGDTVRMSLTVKSVTAPIAVELAALIDGDPALAAIFVIATGMLGVMFGPWIMTRTGIVDPLARGLALGTISHGQGAAHAITEGELQGAIAGIAMGIGAVLSALALPNLVPLLAH